MRILTVLLIVILSLNMSFARFIHVPEERETIQEAVDIASDGDVVLIHPGTYYENIVIDSDNISLASLYYTTGEEEYIDSTVINSFGNGTVIRLQNIESEATFICGLTITDGHAEYGGGLFLTASSPSITHCVIRGNEAHTSGGGLCCMEESYPVITHSIFDLNETNIGGGGGIYSDDSGPILQNCVISRNHCDVEGGGGLQSNNGVGGLVNCTIAENRSDGEGGAVFCSGTAELDVVNCIFWGNELWEICLYNNNDIRLLYTDVDGGRDSIVAYEESEAIWSEGCINADPEFLNPEDGDFRLTVDSPCIDTGHPQYPYDTDHTRADMGALFYNQAAMMIVEPEELQFDPYTGDVDTLTFEITSIGSNTLHVRSREIIPLDPPNVQGFYIVDDFEELNIEQDSTFVTQVVFAPPFAAEYEGSLQILSNDLDHPELFIVVLGTSLRVEKEESGVPQDFEISGITPNPFNSTTQISYVLPAADQISIKLYDIHGRELIELETGYRQAGSYTTSISSDGLVSGLYILQLTGTEEVRTEKLVLIK